MRDKHILVLGAGPAGSATAIGLVRLGYRVSLIGSSRSFAACEGISKRTLEGLRSAGCLKAATAVTDPSPKYASWNGGIRQFNTEHLVSRSQFDIKLSEDLRTAGVTQLSGRVLTVDESKQGWMILYQDSHSQKKTIRGDFLVEARGRSSALKDKKKIRGPETVSLLQHWKMQSTEDNAASMALSYPSGWVWLAKMGTDLYTQVTVSARDPRLPKKTALQPFIINELKRIPESHSWIKSAVPFGPSAARASTSILAGELVSKRQLRVGDAALAVDPLSGNGIFQSLSLGLSAPAVINTLIRYPKRAQLAVQFYREKCRETFFRFCRIGRDFYAQEQRWSEHPFWRERAQWPDVDPLHVEPEPAQTLIKMRPVLAQNQILNKAVLITSDQPLGIWRVAGIELAPILKELFEQPDHSRDWMKTRLLSEKGYQQSQRAALLDWLIGQRFIQ